MQLGRTPTYRAPEFDYEDRITHLSDMWSFGCVFLEFTSWLLLGNTAVESFTISRVATSPGAFIAEDTFFSQAIHGVQGEVKPAVKAVRQTFSITARVYSEERSPRERLHAWHNTTVFSMSISFARQSILPLTFY
ncbi:hypothetical protein F5X68DRAFT_216395 [Plectosphaerella plurivora]|uniref:Protein kinase domain-containing protein n=1 Tax=Plectosphaerella plurivora TaxID=936078 RepID=A0A9P9A5N8_9PEZI|nr:hypothetical protein F5X68DRAFT_216395 [Plectosphaerella plurivora]